MDTVLRKIEAEFVNDLGPEAPRVSQAVRRVVLVLLRRLVDYPEGLHSHVDTALLSLGEQRENLEQRVRGLEERQGEFVRSVQTLAPLAFLLFGVDMARAALFILSWALHVHVNSWMYKDRLTASLDRDLTYIQKCENALVALRLLQE